MTAFSMAKRILHPSLAQAIFSTAPFAPALNKTSAMERETEAPLPVRKIFVPRRTHESRFAPPQYFYSASRNGAVPTNLRRQPTH